MNLFREKVPKIACNNCGVKIGEDDFICPECNTRQICFDREEGNFYRIVNHDIHESLPISVQDFIDLKSFREVIEYKLDIKVSESYPTISKVLETIEFRLNALSTHPEFPVKDAAKSVLQKENREPWNYEIYHSPYDSVEKKRRGFEKEWPFSNGTNCFDFDTKDLKTLYVELIDCQYELSPRMSLARLIGKIWTNYVNRKGSKVEREEIPKSKAQSLGLYKSVSCDCSRLEDERN